MTALDSALREQIAGNLVRAEAVAAGAGALADDVHRHEDDALREETARLVSAHDALDAQLHSRQHAAAVDAVRRAGDAALELAPGPFGVDTPDLLTEAGNEGPRDFIRLGTIGDATSGHRAPALVPFLNRGGLQIAGSTSESHQLVETIVARLIRAIPLGQLTLDVYDPGLTGLLANFAGLRRSVASSYPPVVSDNPGLRKRLDDAVTQVTSSSDTLRVQGIPTVGRLWESTQLRLPYRVMVLDDYPNAYTPEDHTRLVRLASGGPARGVSLAVLRSASPDPDPHFDPTELLDLLGGVDCAPGGLRLHVGGAVFAATPDAPLGNDEIQRVVELAAGSAAHDRGPMIPLSGVFAHGDDQLWDSDATDGLTFDIGESADGHPLTVAFRSENPPLPNALIGGAVGQGKSNLLLDIIYSMTARYSPEEVTLQLLDFKQGLEFRRFDRDSTGENWLPHASVISLESDRAFGLAVLENVLEELEARSRLFKAAGASGYSGYRRDTGARLPRRVVIVDEFQVLFDGDDETARKATDALTSIAKLGRAYGVHLILSSQTLSGIRGLAVKLDSIFAQFPIRIALKNTASESQTILGQGNTAAADLRYRGELILNQNYGMDPASSNQRGFAAFAEPEFTADLQRRLWSRRSGTAAPLLFLGNSPTPWNAAVLENAHADVEEGIGLVLGRPVSVSTVPLVVAVGADSDQGIAIVGTDQETIGGILASAAVSAIASGRVDDIVVLNVSDATPPPWRRTVDEAARRYGVRVRAVPAAESGDYLLRQVPTLLETRSSTAPAVLFLVEGVQRIPGLFDEVKPDPDDMFGPTTSAAQSLRELSSRGAGKQLHLLASWNSLGLLERTNGFDHDGLGHYVLVGQSSADIKRIGGFDAEKPEGSPRFVYFRRNSDSAPVVAVPYELPHPTEGAS